MAMRVTQRSGRMGSAKHNDRSFLNGRDAKEIAPHIDHERTEQNRVVGASSGKTLEESELAFYRKRYGQALEERNARYRAQRHPERCRTIEDVYRNEKTRPRETILQIGDMHEGVSKEKLEECFADYLQRVTEWNKAHGEHLRILNAAVHVDEASPHIHMRSVWEYTDKNGNFDLGQNKGLKQAGVDLPDPEKPEGKFNNRMMTFEATTREMWQEVCKEHGLEIETEPRPRRKHLDKADFIAEQKQAEIEKLEALEAQKQKDLDKVSAEKEKADKELLEAQKDVKEAQKTIARADKAKERIEALEAQERVLTAAQVKEVDKNVKSPLLSPDKVILNKSDYEALVRTAHGFEEANRQSKKINKQKKAILDKAHEEAAEHIQKAKNYESKSKSIWESSAKHQLDEIKQDHPEIFNSLGVYQRGHSVAEIGHKVVKDLSQERGL